MEYGTHAAWSRESPRCAEGSRQPNPIHQTDLKELANFTEITAVNRPSSAQFLEQVADAGFLFVSADWTGSIMKPRGWPLGADGQ